MEQHTKSMSCTVEVEYLQHSLKSYYKSSKSIDSSAEFNEASDAFDQLISRYSLRSSSSADSESFSDSQNFKRRATVSGSGWGVSLAISSSHGDSSSASDGSSSANATTPSNQMSNAFLNVKTCQVQSADCPTKNSMEKPNLLTVFFK